MILVSPSVYTVLTICAYKSLQMHVPTEGKTDGQAGGDYPNGYTEPDPLTDESRQYCKRVIESVSYSLE